MKNLLTETAAKSRALLFAKGIDYQLFLNLEKGNRYSGAGHFTFNLAKTDPLFLDYNGKNIDSILVNEVEHKPKFEDGKIFLQPDWLKTGQNTFQFNFENEYYTDGNGVHSYIDEGNQFLYCQSEPYWGNRIFPMFDQPDLKARLKLVVAAPSDWSVLFNTFEIKNMNFDKFEKEVAGTKKLFDVKASLASRIKENILHSEFKEKISIREFEPTRLLSTYLYCFVAGPYKKIEHIDKKHHDPLPMTIYYRPSLEQYAKKQADSIFSFTSSSVKYFEKLFDYEYPFGKCDLVFCPEYTVGAMEYPGIITFNDQYIFKEEPTPFQVTRRGMTIAHEVAHMWFGNLVTMKWWNDLWLNESFADFVCYLCVDEIRNSFGFKTVDSWESFVLNKAWGYREDQKSTTHPIATKVDTTSAANSIFDGITYAKGAAVIKQLYFRMGHENFSKKMAKYFLKYQWSNATLDQFFAELAAEPGEKYSIDMNQFNHEWIQLAGLNVVHVEWLDSKVKLIQSFTNPHFSALRHNKMLVAVYDKEGRIIQESEVTLTPEGHHEITINNPKKAVAVLPNHQDWAYIKVDLDKKSKQFFIENLGKLHNGVDKLVIMQSIYESAVSAQLKSTDYVTAVANLLPDALDNQPLFQFIIDTIANMITNYMPEKECFEYSSKIFAELLTLYREERNNLRKKILLQSIVGFAIKEADVAECLKLYEEYAEDQEKFMNLNTKWRIVFKSFAFNFLNKTQKSHLIDRMTKHDKTELKKRFAMMIDALTADHHHRHSLWKTVADRHRKISYIELGDTMSGLFSIHLPKELKDPFFDEYFKVLPEIIKHDTNENAKYFMLHCPVRADQVLVATIRYEEILNHHTDLPEFFTILIKKQIDELQKRAKALGLFIE